MISFDINNPKPKGPMYVAKLRATDSKKDEYYLYDSGGNPHETDDEYQWRMTLMGIYFGCSKMHSIGNIRTTNISIFLLEGELDPDEETISIIKLKDSAEITSHPNAISIIDKKPKWSSVKNKYVYNFAGRCNKASVKNTQLVPESFPFNVEKGEDSSDTPIYQFGRWDNNVFNIDFYHPMSILGAFGMSIAIFDTY
jgi:hypothetical protein